jgi:hypothetical protein
MGDHGDPPNKRAALSSVLVPDAGPTIPRHCRDRLSGLPDHLLVRILRRLPAMDAVATERLLLVMAWHMAQLPFLEFHCVEPLVSADALTVYRAHGKLDIHRLTIYTDQMDARPTTEWLSLAAPRLASVLYFDNSHNLSWDYYLPGSDPMLLAATAGYRMWDIPPLRVFSPEETIGWEASRARLPDKLLESPDNVSWHLSTLAIFMVKYAYRALCRGPALTWMSPLGKPHCPLRPRYICVAVASGPPPHSGGGCKTTWAR